MKQSDPNPGKLPPLVGWPFKLRTGEVYRRKDLVLRSKAVRCIQGLVLIAAFCYLPQVPAASAIETHTLNAVGHGWTYHMHRPTAAGPLPLVLVFHGAGGGGKSYLERNGWIAASERNGFIVVAPDGLPAQVHRPADFRTNPRAWNSGQLNSDRPRGRVDDVGFVDALIDAIATLAPIDPRRIYATGHSNGAGMSYRLAARMPERLAAIAPVMGQNASMGAQPLRPVPTLAILGTADPLFPVEGGVRQLPWGPNSVLPQTASIAAWAQSLGCAQDPDIARDDSAVRVEHFKGCRLGVPFEVWHLKGQGHGWPGGTDSGLPAALLGPAISDLNATETVWKFFSGQVLPLRE